jgi:hypothetical protein
MKNSIKFFIISTILLSAFQVQSQVLNYKDIKVDKPKGKFNEYISKDGISFKIGDTITIGKGSGVNGSFVFLTGISPSFSSYVPDASIYNTKAILDNITIKGNKSEGWKVYVFTKSSFKQNALMFFIEDAIANGELKSALMTSDEALTELKKCKDKLDLGLITPEEFAKQKAELSKYIK